MDLSPSNPVARTRASFTYAVVIALLLGACSPAPMQVAADDQSRAKEAISRLVEANRRWLAAPSEQVKNFRYELHRVSGTQTFEITNPGRTSRARLQGVTYSAMLQQLARAPGSATVLAVSEEPKRMRLTLKFDPALRGAVGNGVENSWNGYHSFGADEGTLLLDTERWVPLEVQMGRLHEAFGEYVEIEPKQFAPLKIRIEVGDSAYDWRFRVYKPGLWLFDDSFSEGRRIAWVEKATVNSAPPEVAHATASSEALAASALAGNQRVAEFLAANRHWLAPSIEPRRGLVYEYRQEEPYVERIVIDPAGNILARLESSKDSPGTPTRVQLRLADGRSYSGDIANAFPELSPAPSPEPKNGNPRQRDRMVQHLGMGLATECALTRLAREPDDFWADVRPIRDNTNRYLMVLRPKHDARLFTGTMLAFTSWAYMHDIAYTRSEVVCDAATHRPLEEKDFDGKDELKGDYKFENWLSSESGAAPGLIRAVIPYQKDGKDQSLEMRAQFQFPIPDVWLLKEVRSDFRGGNGGSTGTLRLLAHNGALYSEISELVQRAEATQKLLTHLQSAPDHRGEASLAGANWSPMLLKADWTDQARDSAKADESRRDRQGQPQPAIIGIYRARAIEGTANSVAVELEGLSTASWKEFRSAWQVSVYDDNGHIIASGSTNLSVRAEKGPTPFQVRFDIPVKDASPIATPKRLRAEGTVERMTGAYHGHGRWMRFAEK